MAKKNAGLVGYLYVVGLALVVIGCFLPLTTHFGGNANGATAVNRISKGGLLSVGAVLALAGAVAGLVCSFVRVKNGRLLKLVALALSIAGGLYVACNINGNQLKLLKLASKITSSSFGIGFYIILVGWILALVGWLLKRN